MTPGFALSMAADNTISGGKIQTSVSIQGDHAINIFDGGLTPTEFASSGCAGATTEVIAIYQNQIVLEYGNFQATVASSNIAPSNLAGWYYRVENGLVVEVIGRELANQFGARFHEAGHRLFVLVNPPTVSSFTAAYPAAVLIQ